VLNSETYQLHDVCHFFVEKALKTAEGFWGMLAKGYGMGQLSGKTNPLTEQLRQVECIVGAVQSVYSGCMTPLDAHDYLQTVGWDVSLDDLLNNVIPQIREFMDKWKFLSIGAEARLDFEF